jgi:hypothetical protein
MNPHRFKVGSSYENEKGSFNVRAIKGESMLIEWDSGERITTPIALQERILTRMEKEAIAPADRRGTSSPVWMGKSFAGLLTGDFKDILRTRSRDVRQIRAALRESTLLDPLALLRSKTAQAPFSTSVVGAWRSVPGPAWRRWLARESR